MHTMNGAFLICSLSVCILSDVTASPNIVILLADDLGIGDVGCFGNDTIKTPNLDLLARNGAKLTHHVTAAAVCTPSRSALLTGRYPIRAGMESSGRNKVFFFVASSGGLPQNETTIAAALKQKGYKTALFGKWHLGVNKEKNGDLVHHPLNHGFDHFYGLPLSNFKDLGDEAESVITAYVPHLFKYILSGIVCASTFCFYLWPNHKKGTLLLFVMAIIIPSIVLLFIMNLKVINGVLMRNDKVVEQPVILEGLTQRLVKESLEFMEQNAQTKNPFFLFIPFVHVHTALFSTKAFKGKSAHGHYGDNVEEMDWAVGEILQGLAKLGILEDTFVYFSSDNGGHIEEIGEDGQREGGHNGIFKGGKTMAGYEGGIRVPSIVSWPGKVQPRSEIKVLTSQMDIYPTIMEITKIPLPNDRIIDGKSLVPLLTGSQLKSAHNILFHYCGIHIHAATYVPDGHQAWKVHWTTPNFLPNTTQCSYVCHCFGKYVVHHDPPLLYDLTKEPSEKTILDVHLEKHKDIIQKVNKLRLQLEASVTKVQSQFSFSNSIWKPWLQLCCNFPYCHCRDPKYSSTTH